MSTVIVVVDMNILWPVTMITVIIVVDMDILWIISSYNSMAEVDTISVHSSVASQVSCLAIVY